MTLQGCNMNISTEETIMNRSIIKLTLFILLSAVSNLTFTSIISANDVTKGSTSNFKSLTVNINKASAEEIADVMIGVGLSKAKFIVAYRKREGEFKNLNALLNVKGIGAVTLEKNRHKIKL